MDENILFSPKKKRRVFASSLQMVGWLFSCVARKRLPRRLGSRQTTDTLQSDEGFLIFLVAIQVFSLATKELSNAKLSLVFTGDANTGASTSIRGLCQVKKNAIRAKAQEKENFDPCACACACVEAVFTVK